MTQGERMRLTCLYEWTLASLALPSVALIAVTGFMGPVNADSLLDKLNGEIENTTVISGFIGVDDRMVVSRDATDSLFLDGELGQKLHLRDTETGSSISIIQIGSGNGIMVAARGVHNSIEIVQSGRHNFAQITQSGVMNSVSMHQGAW